ncbi:MAG TPA: patatin-like phospholipase family protein [Burkholderiaceae bacterium]|nr:patatin-like phospholipase family protein [Burkholderiaceae bacterium]
MSERRIRSIDLALQGGGAHGAFTWGVLDRLLDEQRLSIDGLSGTSAGAMNAVVFADGWVAGGRDGARRALQKFWRAVSVQANYSPMRRSPLDMLFGRWSLDSSPAALMMDLWSRMVSPYEFNPLNLNPLRALLSAQVDFDRVRRCSSPRLFVTATNVRSGKARIFRAAELNADAVMASACLPFLFQAVEIDGDAYWDGGYMGNPALLPLVEETDSRDLVIVQINPIHRDEVPRTSRDILNRLNEITFNASLIKEVRTLWSVRQLIADAGLDRRRYKDMRLHRIHAEGELHSLGESSKLSAEWLFLKHLHDVGWRAADQWLARSFNHLGRRTTIDVEKLYL